jgi:hypothetical protein
MGNYDDLPVFKASCDLLLEIFRLSKHFSKEYKYIVGTNLNSETMDLMLLIYQANNSIREDGSNKKGSACIRTHSLESDIT